MSSYSFYCSNPTLSSSVNSAGSRIQLILLLISLSCCGSIVGFNRLLPRLAHSEFGTESHSSILHFIVLFGIAKACTNVLTGAFADTCTRKLILIIGWCISFLSPLIILLATSWSQVLIATAFLGASQGLLTSICVVMLMDRVSPLERGSINGLLESIIYISLASSTYVSGSLEEKYKGYRPSSPVASLIVSGIGLLASIWVIDTSILMKSEQSSISASISDMIEEESVNGLENIEKGQHRMSNKRSVSEETLEKIYPLHESTSYERHNILHSPSSLSRSLSNSQFHHSTPPLASPTSSSSPLITPTFVSTLLRTFSSSHLFSIIQAGFINNFKDGLAWGLFPALFAQAGVSVTDTGYLLTTYPLVWGLGQLFTGSWSDKYGRKVLVVSGLTLESISLAVLSLTPFLLPTNDSSKFYSSFHFFIYLFSSFLLGFGTALCYPVLQAALGDAVRPERRAPVLGIYRFCRDSGYCLGGLFSGVVADIYGVDMSVRILSGIIAISSMFTYFNMTEKHMEGSRRKSIVAE